MSGMPHEAQRPRLEPCPFCGGEAHLVDDYSSEHDHTFYQVWHDCTTSPGAIRRAYGHALSLQISTPWCANEKDAVLLWNRRAERKCHLVECPPSTCARKEGWATWPVCSECGGAVRRNDKYCSHCGALVIGDGDAD